MIYAVQIFVALFSWLAGRHDGVPVSRFENDGATPAETSRFHSTGLKMRICNAAMGSVCVFIHHYTLQLWPAVLMSVAAGSLCWLISWSVFDPSVNVSRYPKRPWWYLGWHAGVDRWLLKSFGLTAGKKKIVVCAFLVATANALLILFT